MSLYSCITESDWLLQCIYKPASCVTEELQKDVLTTSNGASKSGGLPIPEEKENKSKKAARKSVGGTSKGGAKQSKEGCVGDRESRDIVAAIDEIVGEEDPRLDPTTEENRVRIGIAKKNDDGQKYG